jgi:methionyl-tRNA synthetase
MNEYITTPIFYANAAPHLGHAYTVFIADVLSRYYKLKGKNTFLITGTDEHGQKIEDSSINCTPRHHVDKISAEFIKLWSDLELVTDDFVRTTEDRHKQVVLDFWKRLEVSGNIYLGEYTGLYCIECEQYYTERQLVNGDVCPVHNAAVQQVSEPSYFFRLSQYQRKLIDFLNENTGFIFPQFRRQEVLRFLENEQLNDLSISRVSSTWGIPVPNDDRHVIYVWVDALCSYLTALGGHSTDRFEQYWPNATHIIGKDILTFHAVYWPALLWAAGLSAPKRLLVHGWWKLAGSKISKSNPKSYINPLDITKLTTNDGLRYFLCKRKPLEQDGEIDIKEIVDTVNADLADNIGNLLNRHTTLVEKCFKSQLIWPKHAELTNSDTSVIDHLAQALIEVDSAYSNFDISRAAKLGNILISQLNAYFQQQAPWELYRQGKIDRVAVILCLVHEGLRLSGYLLEPLLPHLTEKLRKRLNCSGPLCWPNRIDFCGGRIQHGEVLFPKIVL